MKNFLISQGFTPIVKGYNCFIALMGACYRQGFNIHDVMLAVADKMDINQKRTWVKLPDGTYQHKD